MGSFLAAINPKQLRLRLVHGVEFSPLYFDRDTQVTFLFAMVASVWGYPLMSAHSSQMLLAIRHASVEARFAASDMSGNRQRCKPIAQSAR